MDLPTWIPEILGGESQLMGLNHIEFVIFIARDNLC